MTKAELKAAQEEREHCIRLIEAPLPGLRALAAGGPGMKTAEAHIKALTGAATAVRESGAFRDAMETKKGLQD